VLLPAQPLACEVAQPAPGRFALACTQVCGPRPH
jgi:hypothetical protein